MIVILIVLIIFLVLLATAFWHISPTFNSEVWNQDPEGRDVDPTGNLTAKPQGFDKPDDEGDLL